MNELLHGLVVILLTLSATCFALMLIERYEIETNLREWRRKRAARRWWAEFQTWRNRRG